MLSKRLSMSRILVAFSSLTFKRHHFIMSLRKSSLVVWTDTYMGLRCSFTMRSMSASVRLVSVTKEPYKKEVRKSSSMT